MWRAGKKGSLLTALPKGRERAGSGELGQDRGESAIQASPRAQLERHRRTRAQSASLSAVAVVRDRNPVWSSSSAAAAVSTQLSATQRCGLSTCSEIRANPASISSSK